jgi:pimeloyl-ACP methyl ester carboxylesterase
MNRRQFAKSVAITGMLTGLAPSLAYPRETMAMPKPTSFRLSIAEDPLEDLRNRLQRTRWPLEPDGDSWERGIPGAYLRKLVEYWKAFDWAGHETAINRFDQVLFSYEGQDIHAFHVRSPEADAMPLVLLHGWPSCGLEYLKVFEPLANPGANGGKAADAFHVIAPTMPGFGLSPAATTPGWNMGKVAEGILSLVSALGYDRFAVHGTDMGAGVAGELDRLGAGRVIGLHTGTDSDTAVAVASFTKDATLARGDLTEAQKAELSRRFQGMDNRNGYLAIQASRPKTLGFALHDSPVGQLAWIAEKFAAWTDPKKALIEDAVDLDQFLAIASTYWFGGGGAGSAHAIWESMRAMGWGAPTATPKGIIAFSADDLTRPLLDPQGAMQHWTSRPDGGHFPAMELPTVLVEDLRSFFATLKV